MEEVFPRSVNFFEIVSALFLKSGCVDNMEWRLACRYRRQVLCFRDVAVVDRRRWTSQRPSHATKPERSLFD